MARLSTPTRRWLRRWSQAHVAAGGWGGPATIAVLTPLARELYCAGATPRAAGLATADQYHLHCALADAREIAEVH